MFTYDIKNVERERELAKEIEEEQIKDVSARKALGLLLSGGIATVLLSRFGLVNPGLAIAHYFHVSPAIIGLTMMAIGTSLPEVITAVVASRKGHGEIALGNAVGASILNVLLVLGVAGLINPLEVDRQTLFFNVPAALALTGALFIMGRSSLTFSRREGIVLVMMYVIYVSVLFTLVY